MTDETRTRIAIVGSRDLVVTVDQLGRLLRFVGGEHFTMLLSVQTLTILTGDCPRGVDLAARRFAVHHQLPLEVYCAGDIRKLGGLLEYDRLTVVKCSDWHPSRDGKAAGPIRNRRVVKAADLVALLWTGTSSGSRSVYDITTSERRPLLDARYGDEKTPCNRDNPRSQIVEGWSFTYHWGSLMPSDPIS